MSRAFTSLQPSGKKDVDGRDKPGNAEDSDEALKEGATA
jgi:hypothetical protein